MLFPVYLVCKAFKVRILTDVVLIAILIEICRATGNTGTVHLAFHLGEEQQVWQVVYQDAVGCELHFDKGECQFLCEANSALQLHQLGEC